MRKCENIWSHMRRPSVIYDFASCKRSLLDFPIYDDNFIFFFISEENSNWSFLVKVKTALFIYVFEAFNSFLTKSKYVAEIQLPGNAIQQPSRSKARVLSWLAV
jgi:hypothetical protein